MNCYVYVIRNLSGAIKIGIADSVDRRLQSLQTGNHELLTVVYSLKVGSREIALAMERLFHERYAADSVRGEWFFVDTERLIDDIRFVIACTKVLKSMEVHEQGKPAKIYKPSRKAPKVTESIPVLSEPSAPPNYDAMSDDELYQVVVVQAQSWSRITAAVISRRLRIDFERAETMMRLLNENDMLETFGEE